MKAISLAFNHLDFIVNPLQTAGMNREATVTDNSVSISGKGFGELDHRFYFTLESQRAPKMKKSLGILWVSILPEPFKIVFQNIDCAQGFIKFQNSLQLRFFFFKKILWILKQKIFASFYHFFTRLVSLSKLYITNLIYYSPEGTDHMKLVKDDGTIRTMFFHRFDIWIPHIHSHSFYALFNFWRKLTEELLQGVFPSALPYPQNFTTLPVNHHRQVFVPLLKGDFVHSQKLGAANIWQGKSFLKEAFTNILYRLPVQLQVLRNLFYGQDLTKIPNILSPADRRDDSCIGLYQTQILHHQPTPIASERPVSISDQGPSPKDIQILTILWL